MASSSIVSIYATLWHLQFPRHGDVHSGCEWVDVLAQGVPAHIGTPTGQEYESPLLVLTGPDYAAMPFQVLHDRLCTALRGTRPRLVLEVFGSDLATTLVFEDGSKVTDSGRN